MVFVVSRGQDFAFVDIVHAQRLKDARLHKVADARLGHDGNAHGLHDAFHDGGIGHPGDTPGGANIRRYTFQSHDGARAGILSDFRLFGRGDVHDHAALEHLREARLEAKGTLFHQ